MAASPLLLIPSASAAGVTPSFPNNVVVFPDRDFVSVEGYSEYAGQTALIEVTRPGVGVIGAAKSLVSGTDVAFEVNHPGGVCWGAGTSHNVTPDIKAGDVVSVTFENGVVEETKTASAAASDMVLAADGVTLTVAGTYGSDVDTARMEQRIINPDMKDTAVGRRDIRAVPGITVEEGYTSELTFPAPGEFLATYKFLDPAVAKVAAAADLGERAMSWQVEDADGNRQGLTIAEFGELGGPGMGGCPAGPGEVGAPQPGSASMVRSADKTSIRVTWTPATDQAGTAPVDGYSVLAVGQTPNADGHKVQIGTLTDAAATQTTITGLSPAETYDVQVRSTAGGKMSPAFTVGAQQPTTDPVTGDVTPPTLALSPAPAADGAVTEASSVTVESNGQVFYTTDGSAVVAEGDVSDAAQNYTGPIAITEPVTLKVVAFDQAGNISPILEGQYAPPAGPTQGPVAPELTGTALQGSVKLDWNAVDGATAYQVTVYNPDGTTTQPAETTARTQTVSGLTGGTSYGFTVVAKNSFGPSTESNRVDVTPAVLTDTVTITSARWRTGEFRVGGSTSSSSGTVTIHRASDGLLLATGSITAAVAPETGGDFSIRLRNGQAPAQNPGQIIAKSSGGGVTPPFTVTR